MEENKLVKGEVKSTLLKFSFPFLMTYILVNLYSTVDLFVVGHYVSTSAVSAVSIGGQVMNTILMLFLGFCTSITVMVGRKVGEGDKDGATKVIGNTITVLGIVTVVLVCVIFFGNQKIVSIMQTPAEAVSSARSYLLICGLGIPLIVGYNLISEIFHGLGDSKSPLIFVAIACIINIVLDFVLVGYCGMGAKGAAFATVTAQGISFALGAVYLRYGKSAIRIKGKDLRPNRLITGEVIKIGAPMSLYYLQRSISYLIVTAIINTGGVIASSSAGVTESIIAFMLMFPSSIGAAISVMAAQNLGANEKQRVKMILRWGLKICIGCGTIMCLYCQIAPQTLTGIIIKDQIVVETAALYLRSYSIDCILIGITCCLNAYFIAHGKSGICMFHVIMAAFCGRIPMSYMLSRLPGTTLWHMGFAAPTGSLISIAICIIFYVRMQKKEKIAV